jgi:hypothetical protein
MMSCANRARQDEPNSERFFRRAHSLGRSGSGSRRALTMAMSCLSIGLFAALILAQPVGAMTSVTGAQLTGSAACFSANSDNTGYLATNVGPSGKTWTVAVKLGLENNDNLQYTDIVVQMLDHTSGNTLGWVGFKHYNWMYLGDNEEMTITASVASTFDLHYEIYNNDSQSECYYLSEAPQYW